MFTTPPGLPGELAATILFARRDAAKAPRRCQLAIRMVCRNYTAYGSLGARPSPVDTKYGSGMVVYSPSSASLYRREHVRPLVPGVTMMSDSGVLKVPAKSLCSFVAMWTRRFRGPREGCNRSCRR